MRKKRFFATAGEKRKFYNNMRHFGRTRDIGLAGFAMLPALLPITLIAMIVFAIGVFFLGGPEAHQAASTGIHAKHQVYTVLGMAVMRKSIELKDQLQRDTVEYRQTLKTIEDREGGKFRPTADEKEKLRKMDEALNDLEEQIQMHDRQEERERKLAGGAQARKKPPVTDDGAARNDTREKTIRGSEEYATRFSSFLRNGEVAFNGASPEIRAALQSDSDTGGGYTVASEEFSDRFIQSVNNQVFIRQLATIDTVSAAQSLGVPTLASDPDDPDWTSEIATGSEDTGMTFGKRELRPHPLAKRIKVSKKMIRLNPKIEAKVIERLSYKFAVAQEKGFLTGNGAEQPLGVFTASANGITTGRDVVTGSAIAILADSLFDVFYSLKAQYQMKAVWGFHRDAVKQIRKLKDTQNRYLWEPAITGGQPSLILDRPFFMSEYAPNTFTTGLYVGIVGDFSFYNIADALNLEIQRLTELYAESNQVGFIGRAESDGMPVLEEAFARLKTS
jgi:HK97 family phage major capsid protein